MKARLRLSETEYGFWVEDHGCGIAPEEIAKVTEPFYMVDKSRSRAAGGAGLGLALCAQIARLHDGELEIESTPGVGSRMGPRFAYIPLNTWKQGACYTPEEYSTRLHSQPCYTAR